MAHSTAAGLLIVRAWVEPSSSTPLRARVVSTHDVELGMQREDVVADADAVCALVRRWLLEVTAAP